MRPGASRYEWEGVAMGTLSDWLAALGIVLVLSVDWVGLLFG